MLAIPSPAARSTAGPSQTAAGLLRLIAMLLCLAALAAGPAAAQVPTKAAGDFEAAKGTVDMIEARLTRADMSDAVLQQLRAEIDPVVGQMNAVVAELSPRIDAAKARLAQLGPKPDPKTGTPEAADIAKERDAQQSLFNDLDATAKRAKVMAVQAQQISDTILARRRALFAHDLFTRSTSLLDPALWASVGAEMAGKPWQVWDLLDNWVAASLLRLSLWQRSILSVLTGVIVLAYWPVWQLAVRVRSRNVDADPTRLRKCLAALKVASFTAIVPVATALSLQGLAQIFDLPSGLQKFGSAVTVGVSIVAVSTGLARGLLAPKSANWRLPAVSDAIAKSLYHLTISITAIEAVQHVAEALGDLVMVSVQTAIAARGLGALAVAVVIGAALRKAWLRRRAAGAPVGDASSDHWAALLRLTGRLAALVLLAAVLVGYVAFAAFMVEQLSAIAATLALLYLLLVLAEEGFAAVLKPTTLLGGGLTDLFSLRPDSLAQIAILLSGVVRLSLYVVAVVLVLAPWRIESGDMVATVEAAFFGFSVGDVRISISAIMVSVLLFCFAIGATKALQRWLETKYLPRTRLDTGLQNSIKTSLGYIGVIVALSVSLAYLGLSFERLTLIAGGLSLGIGLGLQSITNNFVSGLILLWERAVRVGDWVEVGAEQGFVRRINVRSTEIETFDRALVIMPNASLVGGVVKNWVRNDRVGRVKLPFVLPLSADPEEVRTALIGTAKAHEQVLSIPTPQVLFTGLSEANMTFDLICFIEDVEGRARVTSDLLYEIHTRLKAAGYVNPPAAPTVGSPALDKLDDWLTASSPRRSRWAA